MLHQEIRARIRVSKTGLSTPVVFLTDRSKAAPLSQFFFICASVVSYVPFLFIPHHTIVAGYYGLKLDVRVSVRRPSVCLFLFPDDNLSKRQWIFTKLGMCIDTEEIWFGQILSNFYGYLPETCPYFRFRTIT